MKTFLVLTSAAIGMIATSSAATYSWQDAFKVGLFVQGNATVGNSESEGTIIVGGNLTTAQNPYQVRLRAGANTIDGVAMAVGGEVSIGAGNAPGVKVSGSVIYGSSNKPLADQNSNQWIDLTQLTIGPSQSQAAGGTPLADRTRTTGTGLVNVTQAFADLTTLSNQISTLAGPAAGSTTRVSVANNTFTLPSNTTTSSPTYFNKGFHLYNVLASEINNVTFNATSFAGFSQSDLIVINVINNIGTNTLTFGVDFGAATDTVSNPWADNILWNVSDANLTLATGNKPFVGSLLAPGSTFIHNNQPYEGSLIVKTYNGSNAGELHPGTPGVSDSTFSTSAVPEPTSALAGVLLALGLFRRQRR